jgi:hypothetical protein
MAASVRDARVSVLAFRLRVNSDESVAESKTMRKKTTEEQERTLIPERPRRKRLPDADQSRMPHPSPLLHRGYCRFVLESEPCFRGGAREEKREMEGKSAAFLSTSTERIPPTFVQKKNRSRKKDRRGEVKEKERKQESRRTFNPPQNITPPLPLLPSLINTTPMSTPRPLRSPSLSPLRRRRSLLSIPLIQQQQPGVTPDLFRQPRRERRSRNGLGSLGFLRERDVERGREEEGGCWRVGGVSAGEREGRGV